MNRTFTDDDGNRYEIVPSAVNKFDNGLVVDTTPGSLFTLKPLAPVAEKNTPTPPTDQSDLRAAISNELDIGLYQSRSLFKQGHTQASKMRYTQMIDKVMHLINAQFEAAIGADEEKYKNHANGVMLEQANEQVRYNNHFRRQARLSWYAAQSANPNFYDSKIPNWKRIWRDTE
jgi:hypothetical protein